MVMKNNYTKQQFLFLENNIYKNFANYLFNKSCSISEKAEWFGKNVTDYKVDVDKEYKNFLKKSKIETDEEIDQIILKTIHKKLEKTFWAASDTYKNSIAALLQVVTKCQNDTIILINEELNYPSPFTK